MITEIILPVLGETMNEGAIVEWLKAEGDPVRRGEVLYTIESDKATLEVEASTDGYLRKILVPAGQTVPVLTVVGWMTPTADEPLGEGAGERESGRAGERESGRAGERESRRARERESERANRPRAFSPRRAHGSWRRNRRLT